MKCDTIEFFNSLLDNLKDPFVFVDRQHIIRYMNQVALSHYERGDSLVGKSIFDCHNKISKKVMMEIVELFEKGLDEKIITDNEKYRIFMRAIRNSDGEYIGYYERYEPPKKI